MPTISCTFSTQIPTSTWRNCTPSVSSFTTAASMRSSKKCGKCGPARDWSSNRASRSLAAFSSLSHFVVFSFFSWRFCLTCGQRVCEIGAWRQVPHLRSEEISHECVETDVVQCIGPRFGDHLVDPWAPGRGQESGRQCDGDVEVHLHHQ